MADAYGEQPRWEPARPKLRPVRLAVSWVVSAASVWLAAAIVPGFDLRGVWAAFLVAAVLAVLNAVFPPLLAALRLPYTVAVGFILALFANALLLRLPPAPVPPHNAPRGLCDARRGPP